MNKEEQPTHIVRYFENGYWYVGRVWYKRCKSKEEALEAIEQHNKTTKNKGGYNDYYVTASYEGVDTSNDPKYDKIHEILEKKVRWTDIDNPQIKM